MSQFVETATRAFTAGGALGQYLRVKLSSGLLALAGAADAAVEVGTLEEPSFAPGDVRSVRGRVAPGSRKMVASKSIAAGVAIYPAASGKITDTASSNNPIGTSLEAAAANGDVIECMYTPSF